MKLSPFTVYLLYLPKSYASTSNEKKFSVCFEQKIGLQIFTFYWCGNWALNNPYIIYISFQPDVLDILNYDCARSNRQSLKY